MAFATAETIALTAVGFLAGREEALKHFLNDSGLDALAFKKQLNEPATLAAVLDFVMQDSALLSQFCDNESFQEQEIHNAWMALTSPDANRRFECA